MATAKRLESLERRKAEIEAKIHQETVSPAGNDTKIAKLKREKLAIKEEIALIISGGDKD